MCLQYLLHLLYILKIFMKICVLWRWSSWRSQLDSLFVPESIPKWKKKLYFLIPSKINLITPTWSYLYTFNYLRKQHKQHLFRFLLQTAIFTMLSKSINSVIFHIFFVGVETLVQYTNLITFQVEFLNCMMHTHVTVVMTLASYQL